ncbi:hypothetical protein [Novosphingobium sp. JCM 18896]|uniref:hypothetical protein n=1 Tax=Novosphingobium sp. JCM 18896 TaxID=2989731 RepID=UPI002221F8C3|nr:hypothetical protein [Novosphingobium sp. JCM 18896]MCW1430436.1 hypothetical protein [Novosphingobium sp. JCM 18896]
MRSKPASFLPLVLIAALTACAAATDYPSLERRSAERMTGSARPVTPEAPPPAPAPASPQLTTRLTQLVDQARAAHQRFGARRGNAQRLVAAGGSGAPGSEGWSVATVALSDLESARSDAMEALAELDQLFAAESIAAAETGNRQTVDTIAAARDQVTAMIGEEDEVLASLRGRMRG